MNIVRQAKAIKDNSVLEVPINSFIRRVGSEQVQNSGPLLKCIDTLINNNETLLLKKFKLEPIYDQYEFRQQIWDNLKRRKPDIDARLSQRQKENHHSQSILYTPKYNKFIKELYPLRSDNDYRLFQPSERFFDLKSNHDKYSRINQESLYRRYLDLPKPAPRYLPFRILQDFLDKFALSNAQFANRNVIEGCKLKGDTASAVSAIVAENQRRRDYLNMVKRVFNDLKDANFEITEQEQIRLIYLSYFKDQKDILDGIEDTNNTKELGYNEFTFNDYKSILKTSSERSDVYGILLFLATRHDRFDVIQSILPRIGMGEIIGHEKDKPNNKLKNKDDKNKDHRSFKPIDISLLNLVGFFVNHIERPGYSTYLAKTIEKIKKIPVINGKIVDHLIKMLVDLKLIRHAELLFETAYFKSQGEESQMTQEWLYVYTKLKVLTGDKETFYKLSPSHVSFTSLFRGYRECQQPFERVKQLLLIMDKLSTQTMSTTMYFEIFKGFLSRADWEFDDLIFVLARLVKEIDSGKNDNDQYSLKKLISKGALNINVELQLYMAEFEPARLNPDLRLSRLLMELIFMVCETKLRALEEDTILAEKRLSQTKLSWLQMMEDIPRIGSGMQADRLAYINKIVLIDILSIMF
ncbi:hypothetical protein KGF56_004490 [Candida oxycetoniae]|uniref:Uncharacterized protein n=1 Tax=Candida oxycetoniae TaxID=497107 RepID=A0AAI9STY7_9ASCO|nr:uncharacterized protein KGF56_004490 [Candida oxycetoniae]KAI3402816.2 hypothetical protein KGF56_004490 [Candida oxycetoniae]